MIFKSLNLKVMLLLIWITSINGEKDLRKTISHLNLLLPQIVNPDLFFKISAHNGCYRWKSSNPNILELKEIKEDSDLEEECFSSIEVRVKSKNIYEGIIWITAIDRDTKEILKCESKISPINRIFILTKMKIFDVGNYEEIELLGYDKENNVFNTLEGLKFNWRLEQEEKLSEIISFNDSLIKTSEIRKQIENNKFHSDKIVLKGLKTGKVKVIAKLIEKIPENIESEVFINFIEKFIVLSNIITDEINLPYCSNLNFNLFNIKTENFKNKIKKVELPNKKYEWISEKEIGIVDNYGLFISYNNEKKGILSINDKSSPINNTVKTEIKINEISNINLFIKEYEEKDIIFNDEDIFDNHLKGINNLSNFDNNWNLIVNKEYIVRTFLFDKNNQKLIFPKNFNLSWRLDENIEIIKKGLDYIIIKPKILNTNFIEASLKELIQGKNICHKNWKFKKVFNVLSKVKILKPLKNIILPLIDNNKQILSLIGIGGEEKNYEWISENSSIVSINSLTGVAKALKVGKTHIILRDKRNSLNKDFIEITVDNIEIGQFLEEDLEMLSGEKENTYYKIFNSKNQIFANCTSLIYNFENKNNNLNINFSNQKYENLIENIKFKKDLFKLDENLYNFSIIDYDFYLKNKIISKDKLLSYFEQYKNYGICNKIDLISKKDGVFSIENKFSKGNQLNIKAYNKLNLIHPSIDENIYSNILNITPGSSINIKLSGGPNKWINRINRDLINKINEKSLEKYNFEIISQDNFILTCKDNLKEYNNNSDEIIISYQNQKDNKLLRPINSNFSIQIICNIPKKLKIINMYNKIVDLSNLQILNKEIILRNQKEHLFKVVCLNNNNKLFYNNTSIDLEWNINVNNNEVKLSNLEDSNWYKKLNLGLYTGDLNLKVISEKLVNFDIKTFSISDSLMIKSMKNLFLEPRKSILYNSDKIIHKIEIFNGSGNFKIKVDNPDLINFKYDKINNPREIFVIPKKLGTVKLTVEDNDLKFSQIIESKIKIVEDISLNLEISKEYVEKGKNFNAKIKLFYDKQEIDNNQLQFIPYIIFETKNHILIKEKINFNLYEIKTNSAGILNIGVKIDNFEKENFKITDSNLIEIEIFNPIRIIPNKIILAPGCKTSFKYIDGPSDTIINKHKLKIDYENSNLGYIRNENNFFYFESQSIGEEDIEFKILNSKNEVITEYILKFKISLDINIDIYNNFNINIYQFSKLKLLFYPVIDKEPLTKSICNFSFYYKYKKDNSIEIYNEVEEIDNKKSLKFENFCEDTTKFNCGLNNKYLHFYLNSNKINSIKIELLFDFNFGRLYKEKWINKVLNINIIERLKIEYPLFINHKSLDSHEIILPPKSIFLLDINKIKNLLKVRPNINSERLLEVRDNFEIKTYEMLGYGNLEIENIEIPNEKIFIPVNIVNVSYIMIKNINYKEIVIPQNLKINLEVVLLDSFGRIISTPLINYGIKSFSLDSNIADCYFNSENFTLEVQGKNKGKTIIIIELNDNSKIFDIIEIKVGPVLKNELPINLHVGSNIQLTLVSFLNNKNKKIWHSNNNEILEINPYNGLAKAKSIGYCLVKYNEISNYKINVNVFKINEIKLVNMDLKNIITNIKEYEYYNDVYKFKLRFFDGNREIKDLFVNKNLINSNLELECKCDNTLLNCYAKHTISNNISESFCYVEFLEKYNKNLKIEFKDIINLKAVLMTYDSSFRIEQNFKFKVLWSFQWEYLENKIELSQNKNKIELTALTPNDLMIDTNFFQNYIKKSYIKKDNFYVITIEIPKNIKNSIKDILTIKNRTTNQNKKIELNFNYDKSLINVVKVNFLVNSLNFEDYITIILIFGCIIFGYWYFGKKHENNHSFDRREESYINNNTINNSFDNNPDNTGNIFGEANQRSYY